MKTNLERAIYELNKIKELIKDDLSIKYFKINRTHKGHKDENHIDVKSKGHKIVLDFGFLLSRLQNSEQIIFSSPSISKEEAIQAANYLNYYLKKYVNFEIDFRYEDQKYHSSIYNNNSNSSKGNYPGKYRKEIRDKIEEIKKSKKEKLNWVDYIMSFLPSRNYQFDESLYKTVAFIQLDLEKDEEDYGSICYEDLVNTLSNLNKQKAEKILDDTKKFALKNLFKDDTNIDEHLSKYLTNQDSKNLRLVSRSFVPTRMIDYREMILKDEDRSKSIIR